MAKKVNVLFLLLGLVAGLYMTATAKGDRVEEVPTNTAQTARIATAETCKVYTGVDAGTVNLRSCAGTSCGVLDIVTEGDRLTIITAGAWANVTTEDGVTGWINSIYCKGK
ncbi:MAG: SH3 domain-containing protein [Chloroflexi bacterium]|nr:SH3 domain-containing protein [Chloroflexota bacterium]